VFYLAIIVMHSRCSRERVKLATFQVISMPSYVTELMREYNCENVQNERLPNGLRVDASSICVQMKLVETTLLLYQCLTLGISLQRHYMV